MSLVSVAELVAELTGPRPPTVLDVRWPVPGPPDRAGYLAGHIPGAVFVDLDADLAAPPAGASGGRHPLPGAAAFGAAMRRLGVHAGRGVVVHDGGPALAAARAWWCLRYFGHRDVRVLDGGFAAWAESGRAVAAGEPAPPSPGDFRADLGRLPVLDAAGAGAIARAGRLLDVRSAARYRGEDPVDPVPGHIPGALSAPATGNLDAGGRWLPAAALRERLRALGVPPGAELGVSCGSGVTAAHTALAMELAGEPAPALYVGSWSEWSADPDRPVATGPEPG